MAIGGKQLQAAIKMHDGNLTHVANHLGVTRATVYRLLAVYRLENELGEVRRDKQEDPITVERSWSWRVKHAPEQTTILLKSLLRINNGIVACVAVACGVSIRTIYEWCNRLGLRPRDFRNASFFNRK